MKLAVGVSPADHTSLHNKIHILRVKYHNCNRIFEL
jgi:hypothetical protein